MTIKFATIKPVIPKSVTFKLVTPQSATIISVALMFLIPNLGILSLLIFCDSQSFSRLVAASDNLEALIAKDNSTIRSTNCVLTQQY